MAIAAQFDLARPFSEDLGAIAINHKWGYIDSKGNIVIEPQFDTVMPFKDGLAYVIVGRTSGYINKKGHYVWRTTYE